MADGQYRLVPVDHDPFPADLNPNLSLTPETRYMLGTRGAGLPTDAPEFLAREGAGVVPQLGVGTVNLATALGGGLARSVGSVLSLPERWAGLTDEEKARESANVGLLLGGQAFSPGMRPGILRPDELGALRLQKLPSSGRYGPYDMFELHSDKPGEVEAPGQLTIKKQEEGQRLYVEGVGSGHLAMEGPGGGMGTPWAYGTTDTRSVLNQIKQEYPQAEYIGGFRISGGRAAAGQTGPAWLRLQRNPLLDPMENEELDHYATRDAKTGKPTVRSSEAEMNRWVDSYANTKSPQEPGFISSYGRFIPKDQLERWKGRNAITEVSPEEESAAEEYIRRQQPAARPHSDSPAWRIAPAPSGTVAPASPPTTPEVGGKGKGAKEPTEPYEGLPANWHQSTIPYVDNSKQVPYGAGMADHGHHVYIDSSIPEFDPKFVGRDGQQLSIHKYLAIHESHEKPYMEQLIHSGMSEHEAYLTAHYGRATPAEKKAVEGDGGDWETYEHIVDAHLRHTEHTKPVDVPEDLYTKPYPHSKQAMLRGAADHLDGMDPEKAPYVQHISKMLDAHGDGDHEMVGAARASRYRKALGEDLFARVQSEGYTPRNTKAVERATKDVDFEAPLDRDTAYAIAKGNPYGVMRRFNGQQQVQT